MKVVYEAPIGGDGGMVGLYVEDGKLVQKASYPMDKVLSPVNNLIDAGFQKVEDMIPGDWDKAILEPIKAGLKAEILALIGGG